MMNNHTMGRRLNKSIAFVTVLSYKAVEAGRQLILPKKINNMKEDNINNKTKEIIKKGGKSVFFNLILKY